MPSYRVVEETNRSLDVGLQPVSLGYGPHYGFNPGLLPGFSRSASVKSARPLFGVRYHLGLNEQWGLTACGDVGGLSAGSRTWQLLGTVDYQDNDWLVFHAGLPPFAHQLPGRCFEEQHRADRSNSWIDDQVLISGGVMTFLDAFAVLVLLVAVASGLAILLILGIAPGYVARRRGHPWAQAVSVAGWITLVFGLVFWPLVFIWA